MKFSFGSGRGTRAREALGIDIGAFSIKMVLIREGADGRLTCQAISRALPPHCVKRGLVTSRHEVAAQIKAGWHALGKPARVAALATPMDQALFRWVELPHMEAQALAAAAPFEARRYLSYPVNEAAVALQALQPLADKGSAVPVKADPKRKGLSKETSKEPEPPVEKTLQALLTAAPAAVVKSRVEALEAAGLEVAAVELEAFALLRAAPCPQQGGFWRGRSSGYLMLGEEMSNLTIAQEGRPTFTRAIPWGTQRLIQALTEELTLPAGAVRKILEGDQTLISGAGELQWRKEEETEHSTQSGPVLQSLVRELTRLLSYYSSLFPERSYEGSLATLEMSGGIAGLEGLASYLMHSLGTAIAPTRPLPALQDSIDFVAGTHSQEITAFPVALGLALGLLYRDRQAAAVSETREHLWRREAA